MIELQDRREVDHGRSKDAEKVTLTVTRTFISLFTLSVNKMGSTTSQYAERIKDGEEDMRQMGKRVETGGKG